MNNYIRMTNTPEVPTFNFSEYLIHQKLKEALSHEELNIVTFEIA